MKFCTFRTVREKRTMKIEGSVVLVTGANRGLGAEYVRQLLDRGASKVYAAARQIDSVTNSGAVPIRLDVTSAADIAAAVKRVVISRC